MLEERFLEIMGSEDLADDGMFKEGCNALRGLLIIQKYLPKEGIAGANHDVIYSAGVEALVQAGITEDDVMNLRKENWMVEGGSYLACFV